MSQVAINKAINAIVQLGMTGEIEGYIENDFYAADVWKVGQDGTQGFFAEDSNEYKTYLATGARVAILSPHQITIYKYVDGQVAGKMEIPASVTESFLVSAIKEMM